MTKFHEVILERYRKYGKIYKETIAGETVVHLLDPDYIQVVYQNETKMPYIVPLLETAMLYRRLKKLSPGLGNRLAYDIT
jgi:cytochrome P450 family 49 subfamily A